MNLFSATASSGDIFRIEPLWTVSAPTVYPWLLESVLVLASAPAVTGASGFSGGLTAAPAEAARLPQGSPGPNPHTRCRTGNT
jgi:hypothetical protein